MELIFLIRVIMKKVYISLIIVSTVFALSGCDKVNVENPELSKKTITASIDVDEETKVALDLAGGDGTKKLTWQTGDHIYVFSPKKSTLRGSLQSFTIGTAGDITNAGQTATFTEDSPADWSDAGYAVALVGQDLYLASGGASAYGPRFSLPETYSYNHGNPNTRLIYMFSNRIDIKGTDYSPFSNLTFTPIVSIVKVPVTATSTSSFVLNTIKLEADSENVAAGTNEGFIPLVGIGIGNRSNTLDYSVLAEDGWSWPYREHPAYDKKFSVTLQSIGQTINKDETKNFYIIVAPGDHGSLKVTLNGSKVYTLNTAHFTTARGKIHRLPVLDWDDK